MAMKRTHKDTPLDVGRLQFSASMYKETMVEKLTDNKEEKWSFGKKDLCKLAHLKIISGEVWDLF